MSDFVAILIGALGDTLESTDDAEEGKDTEGVVSGIDLPPVEALTRGGLVAVVVIMPSLAEGDDGEQEAVPAIVSGVVARLSPDMCHGIDATGAVEEEDGADESSPNEHLES
jgi:hypothetical protein